MEIKSKKQNKEKE